VVVEVDEVTMIIVTHHSIDQVPVGMIEQSFFY